MASKRKKRKASESVEKSIDNQISKQWGNTESKYKHDKRCHPTLGDIFPDQFKQLKKNQQGHSDPFMLLLVFLFILVLINMGLIVQGWRMDNKVDSIEDELNYLSTDYWSYKVEQDTKE